MKENRHRSTQTLLILLIFSMFALSSLLLVFIGADAYQKVSRSLTANHQMRTSLSYVANKIRTAEGEPNLKLETMEQTKALVIDSEYENEVFKTYLYCHDGYLMEFFAGAEDPFLPDSGEKLTELHDFSVTQSGGLFLITATAQDGNQFSISVSPRSY